MHLLDCLLTILLRAAYAADRLISTVADQPAVEPAGTTFRSGICNPAVSMDVSAESVVCHYGIYSLGEGTNQW